MPQFLRIALDTLKWKILKKYKQMLSDGLISQADYNAKKKKILGI